MEKKPQFFQQFFKNSLIRHLPFRLIDPLIDESLFKNFEHLSTRDLKDWKNISTSYLSGLEKLALAIVLTNETNNHGNVDYSHITNLSYEALATFEPNSDNFKLAQLLLAVLSFEHALTADGKKQRKLLKVSSFYFNESSEYEELREISHSFNAMVKLCLGQWEDATKSFVKFSKNTDSPEGAFYILSKMYQKLDLPRVALFYHKRYQRSFNLIAA